MTKQQLLPALGSGYCGLSIALHAGAAHALESLLDPQRMGTFLTAAEYLFVGGISVLIVDILSQYKTQSIRWIGGLFASATALFSGSLLALVAFNMPELGMITPLGGIGLIGGWVLLGIALIRS